VLVDLSGVTPIVGVYGKLGAAKGRTTSSPRSARLGAGPPRHAARRHPWLPDEEARFAAALADGGLADATCTCPSSRTGTFLAPARLHLVCALERRFPIAARSPGSPPRSWPADAALVSAEIARKQPFAARLIHGYNVLVVRDPPTTTS
jgi:hypothetical protein